MSSALSQYRLLIGPGVEKCGTTSLHALLEDRPGFLTAKRKETRYFSQHYSKGHDYYQSLYGIAPGEARDDWLVDISPAYFRSRHAYQRILDAQPRALVAVFLIRNPVRRAFSQYWHDIFNHVTRGQGSWGETFRDFSFDTLARERNSYYFTSYTDKIQRFRNTFGENGIVAVFEEVLRDPAPFLAQLSDKTGVDFPGKTRMPRTNPTKYARLELTSDNDLDRVGRHKRIRMNVEDEVARNLLATQGTFTHFVEQSRCEDLFARHFADDISALERLLDRPLPDLRHQHALTSPLWKEVRSALG